MYLVGHNRNLGLPHLPLTSCSITQSSTVAKVVSKNKISNLNFRAKICAHSNASLSLLNRFKWNDVCEATIMRNVSDQITSLTALKSVVIDVIVAEDVDVTDVGIKDVDDVAFALTSSV